MSRTDLLGAVGRLGLSLVCMILSAVAGMALVGGAIWLALNSAADSTLPIAMVVLSVIAIFGLMIFSKLRRG